MGFFKKMFSSEPAPNRFAQHPDVLDKMAKTMARWAMEQLRDDTREGQTGETWVKFDCSWSLSLDNKPESYTRSLGRFTCYGMKFNDYGMEDIPESSGSTFLSAFLPHLRKHCELIVGNYFPGSRITVEQDSYKQEHYRDTDYDYIPAIRIYVPAATKHEPPKPTYQSW